MYGLRNADETILSQVSGEDGPGQEVSHKLDISSVYADLLLEKMTEEVQETIDMSYRVAREADKYEVTLLGDLTDDAVGSDRELSAVAVKKVLKKYEKHPEVFNEKSYYVTLIQENKEIQKKSLWSANIGDFVAALNAPEHDFIPLIDLHYDGFTPRFKLENFITKIVMRETKAGKTKIDLYLPAVAGQFTKTDAILISELYRIKDSGTKKVDFLDIDGIKFVTDKAYGAEDLVEYTISGLKYNKITIFDGSFVLTFNVAGVNTFDIVEAHKTASLSKKYDEMAPRSNEFNIENTGAAERRDEKIKKNKENTVKMP